MKPTKLMIAVLLLLNLRVWAQQKNEFNLIPYPGHLTAEQGVFNINKTTALQYSNELLPEVEFLNGLFKNAFGTKLTSRSADSNVIRISLDKNLREEEYKLKVTNSGIVLAGGSNAGVFRGMQTLRQLMPDRVEASGTALQAISIPALSIQDKPAFAYRGLHLDVSRHFFSIDYLRKYVDRMAMYKFNKLHLHLTDDQGWRIEIKKYPKLTEEGAWRTFNNQDSLCIEKSKDNPDMALDPKHIIKKDGKVLYGGYYTQQEMKDFVKYAVAKHIEIIPEIDMPGHMMAAIKSYPYLSCTGGTKWGKLFTTPICPCNEETYTFAENVFKEIFEIFPSKYVHIGGDEVDRSSWETASSCTELMKKEGITTSAGLQSYFINRMEKFFNQNGKKLIGWDEILEEGISSTAMVMYWRSWVPDAPLKAFKNGNSVIMTPGEPLYFDNQPDKNSLYNVYHFSVYPKIQDGSTLKNIIGAQANVWTERIPSENRVEYMVFPRALALAENLWSHNHLNYDSFRNRLTKQYARLDAMKVHYRLPDLENLITDQVFVEQASFTVQKPLPAMKLKYTTSGKRPDYKSADLTGPLKITDNTVVKLGVFSGNDTTLRELYTVNYQKQALAQPISGEKLQSQLTAKLYKNAEHFLANQNGAKPDSLFYTSEIAVPSTVKAPSFGIVYDGAIDVPEDGVYTFYLTCDDGGVLKIANRLVVDNGGMHAAIEKNGQVALKKGAHPFNLNFVEGGGGFKLKLLYSFGGRQPAEVPESWFKRKN